MVRFETLFSKILLLRKPHTKYNIDQHTACQIVFCFLLSVSWPIWFIISSIDPTLKFSNFHHLKTSSHPTKTQEHLMKQWSNVSISSSQCGQSVELRSIPICCNHVRTGNLLCCNRQIKIQIFLGIILLHFVFLFEFVELSIFSSIFSLRHLTVNCPLLSRIQRQESSCNTFGTKKNS